MPRRVSFAKTPSPTRAKAADSSSSSEDEEVKTSSELTVLYSGEAPLLDLVAVENLSENGQSWGSQGHTCWLRHEDFLPKEIPKARVFSFGYTLGNDFNILALGTALLKALESARSEVERERPIIFIGLGLGSIICIQALLHGSQAPSIFKSTHAAVLVNVPYNKKATTLEKLLGRMVDRCISNPAAELKSRVQREAQYIQNILKSFDGIRDIELISCFGKVPELSKKERPAIYPFKYAKLTLDLNSDFYGPLSFSGPDEEPYTELSEELQILAKAAIHKAEMNSKRRMGDSDYQVIAPLGKDVMKVIHKSTQKLYAQKRLYLEPTSPQTTTNASTLGTTHGSTNSARDAAMNELEILRTVCQANHPNIIGLQDFFTKEPHLYIVMELADGDLAHLLYNRQPTPRRLLLEILAQIVRGVTHLHELGLCHRDLKPQNVLFMPGNVPIFKIADFGISCASPETVNQTVIGRGTAIYRAPEVWKHTYGRQADIWGIGCIVLFLAIGQTKLEQWWRLVSKNLQRLSEEDWEDENPDPPKLPEIYESLKVVLAGTLKISPQLRLDSTALTEEIEAQLEKEPIDFTIDQYRIATSKDLPTQEDTGSIILKYLRSLMNRDFTQKIAPRFYNPKGIDVLLDSKSQINDTPYGSFTALTAASYNGYADIVKLILAAKADVNQKDVYHGATPLHYAAMFGYEEVAKILLVAGADVHATNWENQTPIHIAAGNGSAKIVKLLFDAKATFSLQGQGGKSLVRAAEGGHEVTIRMLLAKVTNFSSTQLGGALRGASRSGYHGLVELFLDRGADLNAQGGEYGNALQAAAFGGSVDVIQLLLSRGAAVNAQGGDYGNALQAASAMSGNMEAIVLLLNNGADCNAIGGRFGTALQGAAYYGRKEVVQRLLDTGADVNIKGGEYGSALLAAVSEGWQSIVELLIEKGADVNANGGHYGNVLQTAVASYSVGDDLIELLVSKGANVNAVGGYFGTALHAAACRNRGKTIRLLVDNGADINTTQNGASGNVLQAGIESYLDEESFEFLLERGADVNLVAGDDGTALQTAICYGRRDIFGLLLDKGADVRIEAGYYGYALQAAAATVNFGGEDDLKMILSKGADINAVGGHFGTALQAAASGTRGDIIRFLLDNGADVNLSGGEYGNALQASAAQNDMVTMKRMLEEGAEVNASGGVWGTPLKAAVRNASLEGVMFLVENGADIDATGGTERTAMELAEYSGYRNIVDFFTEWKKKRLVEENGGSSGGVS